MLLNGCEIVPFTAQQAFAVGSLLGATGRADVVDAPVVHVVGDGEILTSDSGDLSVLADHAPRRPTISPV